MATDIEAVYRGYSRRVFATLLRLLGDFDLAEEALHEAFLAAAEQWPCNGVPDNPFAWLVSAGRFKAIDKLRRRARFDAAKAELAMKLESFDPPDFAEWDQELPDDRLRLIFVCCHPVLAAVSQVALTLREVCGLKTGEIARAFLMTPPTIAQRIVRAKAKIRDAKVPYDVPEAAEWPERLGSVLHVVYLVFNEGYYASSGAQVMRSALSREAIRLCRLLVKLSTDPEVTGLLGLVLLQESRTAARSPQTGEFVLLAEQDRGLWDRALIEEGSALAGRAMSSPTKGAFALQAAIAAVHARAKTAEATDWGEIVDLYDLLCQAAPGPVVELNRAVAVAMRDGPAAGIELIDGILSRGELTDYHLAHAAHGDLLRRLGDTQRSRAAYVEALRLARQEPERRFIERRLTELGTAR
jgi:RNA polymerase sigma-70 factor (ECF subfamily)